MISIFACSDYRDYLQEFYKHKKIQLPFFSYRLFGTKIGVDGSFLSKVLHKKLHVSFKTVQRIICYLKLNEKEAQYFELLVSYNKLKCEEDKKSCIIRLTVLNPDLSMNHKNTEELVTSASNE